MDAGTHLLLAHEMPGMQGDGQGERHGVEFGTFFSCPNGATPGSLLKANIYGQIAVALKGGPWREASMVLMAKGIAGGMEVEPLNNLLAASSLAVLKAALKGVSKGRLTDVLRRSALKTTISPQASVGSNEASAKRGLVIAMTSSARKRSFRPFIDAVRSCNTESQRTTSHAATELDSNSQQAISSQMRCGDSNSQQTISSQMRSGAKSHMSAEAMERREGTEVIAAAFEDQAGSSSAHTIAEAGVAVTAALPVGGARAVTRTVSAPRPATAAFSRGGARTVTRTASAPRPALRRDRPLPHQARPGGRTYAEPRPTQVLNEIPFVSQATGQMQVHFC
jgi:hypothetical protein